MALRKALEALRNALDEMARAVLELRVHVGDEPGSGSALADPFAYGAEDMQGWLAESTEVIDDVLASAGADLDRTRLALGTCHELALEVSGRLGALLAYESITQLRRFGGQPARDPRRLWSESVHDTLERCREPADELQRALLESWQELAERAALSSVSVQTTNIGQQLSVPRETDAEGVT